MEELIQDSFTPISDMLGDAKKITKKARSCKLCKKKLSIYNKKKECYPCLKLLRDKLYLSEVHKYDKKRKWAKIKEAEERKKKQNFNTSFK